jgi:hypothetical protein
MFYGANEVDAPRALESAQLRTRRARMTGPRLGPTPEDDRRHLPGPGSLPLWNESFWFPLYDPETRIAIVLRIGSYPNLNRSNVYLFIAQDGHLVHSVVDLSTNLAEMHADRVSVGGVAIEWQEPLRSFRLKYRSGDHGFDLIWRGASEPYLYPHPPGTTVEQIQRHIEQGGVATGTVTIAGRDQRISAFAHRDHTWGGERDWDKFYSWNYLSGEFEGFWFNAARIRFSPDMDDIHIGCVWDGADVLPLAALDIAVDTVDGGTRQTGVRLSITDERGRVHRIVGEEVLAICPVQIRKTWIKEGFTRYRYGDAVGYGILEHGYVESADPPHR